MDVNTRLFQEFLTQIANVWMSNSDKLKGLVVPAINTSPGGTGGIAPLFLRRISKEAGGEDITCFQGRRKKCVSIAMSLPVCVTTVTTTSHAKQRTTAA